MKIYTTIALALLFSISSIADNKKQDEKKITQWLKVEGLKVIKPAFSDIKNFKEKTFELQQLFKTKFKKTSEFNPTNSGAFNWNGREFNWTKSATDTSGSINLNATHENEVAYVSTYLTVERWRKLKVHISSKSMCELYVDDKLIVGNYKESDKISAKANKEIKLKRGTHKIVVKTFGHKDKDWIIKGKIIDTDSLGLENVKVTLSPEERMNINHIISGKKCSGASLSPSGKYVIMSYSERVDNSDKHIYWKELKNITSGKIIHTFRSSKLSNIKWLPQNDIISYIQKSGKNSDIFTYNVNTQEETLVADNIKDMSYFSWAPNEEFIIYSVSEDNNTKKWKLKKLQGIEDRLSGNRRRSFLYKYNIASGVTQRLTYGKYTTSLHDISFDSKKIAFSHSKNDYNEFPFRKQDLYIMNLETFKVEKIWSDKLFSGWVQFSPNGNKLLVSGGPSCFGNIGVNNNNAPMVNNYDGQLYIYDIASKKVNPITYKFDPAIKSASWDKESGNIIISAEVKDKRKVFIYNSRKNKFRKLKMNQDMISGFNTSLNGKTAIYKACSISERYKTFLYDVKSGKSKLFEDTEFNTYKDVKLGKNKDWNFKKEDGTTIIGRMYLPPNFDKSKKYPLLVYYYGGTSPVGRSFGGRYPYNIWASHGYVVYVLQPTGATGFGQEFSAKHQNNWGIITADEIINGTKKFIKSHKFIDKDNVGCLGASYGGFTTMLLQTRTDIFKAAVSHAGISSISSYWGEGDWGYSYSTNATGKKYPWNAKNIYVDQSPLFNADKFKNSILLFHGTIDNNVPPGESMQFYVALKLLGKDVEFIQVKDQRHFVQNLTQRIMWHNSIMAYFDKYLKSQPQWWNSLWPDKNL